MARPTTKSAWGVSNPDFANRVVEPSTSKKQTAWNDNERPPAPLINWLFWIHGQWIDWLESKVDGFEARYQAIIGSTPDATHATLQDAVNDVTLGTNVWVLVRESQADVSTTISLTKADWRIECAPGVSFTKGAGAPTKCFSLEAEGIEIYNGRIIGWTTSGDIGIFQNASADYCKVIGTRFGPSTDTEVDQSAVTAGKKGPVTDIISEV